MTHQIFFPGRITDFNKYTNAERANRQYGAKMKTKTEAVLQKIIKVSNCPTFTKPVHVLFIWIEKNRMRDKDNIASAKKFVFDSLVKSKVLQGDGWRWVNGFGDGFLVDKAEPGILVTITDEIDLQGEKMLQLIVNKYRNEKG